MKVRLIFLFLLVFLQSCAGYHFITNNNPLIGYDIKSIAVPMFVNRSVIPELAAPLTKEITMALNDYSGLRVYNGNNEAADAVLIGVVDSEDFYNEVVTTTQTLFTDNDSAIKNSIGQRSPFYYPVESSYRFKLKLYLIKRPTAEELSLLQSAELGKFVKLNPKVVLTDEIDLSGTFSRTIAETSGPHSAGKVNFVKNKGIFEKSVQETAMYAAKTFKQVVLNAF